MRNIYYLFIAAALCPAIGYSQQFINGTITSGGQQRSYRIFVPGTYTGQDSVPLVINLHGQPSSAIEAEQMTRFSEVADTAGFILVYPIGSPYLQQSGTFFWNIYGSGADDVGFISNLLDSISAQYKIDQNRIYATGFNTGSSMCYELACHLSHRIAAIGSVSGIVFKSHLQNCNPPRPVPVLHIHGTADNTAPYIGGAIPGSGAFAAADSLVRFWVKHDHCGLTPVITPVPNISTTDGCTAERYLYSGGTAGSTVEFFKIIDGGHTWPSENPNVFSFDNINEDFYASREIWRFFKQFRLDQLVAAKEPEARIDWSFYPNPASDVVTIQTKEWVHSGRVIVADVLGRNLKSVQIPEAGDVFQVDLRELPDGMYFIGLKTDRGYGFMQMMKQGGFN